MKLDPLDLEFLELGMNGPFDENDIVASPLNRLETGRTLDALGSMLERGVLIRQTGGFVISDAVRHHLWDTSIPLGTRMTRLLGVTPLSIPQIKLYIKEHNIEATLRVLQEEGRIYSYPVLRNGVPVPIYQATGDHAEYNAEISSIMQDIVRLNADPHATKAVLDRIKTLASRLGSDRHDRVSEQE